MENLDFRLDYVITNYRLRNYTQQTMIVQPFGAQSKSQGACFRA